LAKNGRYHKITAQINRGNFEGESLDMIPPAVEAYGKGHSRRLSPKFTD